MTSKTRQTDGNYLKMKIALATGGLVATLIGAGLLGKHAAVASEEPAVPAPTITIQATLAESSTDEPVLQALPDIQLEAIPTVSAPTFPSAPLTMGRSSG